MKKFLAFIMVLVLAFSFCACKDSNDKNSSDAGLMKEDSNDKNSVDIKWLCDENVDYIKSVENKVTVTVIMPQGQYVDIMCSVCSDYYGIPLSSETEIEYLELTTTILDEYQACNDNITVKYVDPQSSEFNEISAKHLNDHSLFYGDMIVTSTVDGTERVEVLTFDKIYSITQDTSTYLYQYVISGNILESALTNAIANVISTEYKNIAILTGHGTGDCTEYTDLIAKNNYKLSVISDELITHISADIDTIVINAPTTDFTIGELNVLSSFLKNDGKLGKGLIYFADANTPDLPNLDSWLKEWGIEVSDGVLFGTGGNDYFPGSPTTLATYPVSLSDDAITADISQMVAISEYNVPMKTIESSTYKRKATALMQTRDKVVIAPIGSATTWDEYDDDDKQSFDTVIQSKETYFDRENNEISSYVMAFSSSSLLRSAYSSYSQLCNADIVMLCTERAAHKDGFEFNFSPIVIEESESVSTEKEKINDNSKQ